MNVYCILVLHRRNFPDFRKSKQASINAFLFYVKAAFGVERVLYVCISRPTIPGTSLDAAKVLQILEIHKGNALFDYEQCTIYLRIWKDVQFCRCETRCKRTATPYFRKLFINSKEYISKEYPNNGIYD